MGDRSTIQIIKGDDFSPILYTHWWGDSTLDVILEAAPNMRKGDVSYAFARLVGAFHIATGADSVLGLGVFNATEIQTEDEVGDAGHFQINLMTGEVTQNGENRAMVTFSSQ